MAKVLLIQPNSDIRDKRKKEPFTPLSLLYLATAIEDKHEVKIYDRNIYDSDKQFKAYLREYNPAIVGFTSMASSVLFDIMHLGKIIKKISSKTIIVVGGVHATCDPDSLLKEPYIDYVIRGEGEEAFLEFCNTWDKNRKELKKIRNVNKNPLRPFVDLNKLKIVNYDFLELKKYNEFYVSLSRGCIGNCTFCYNSEMWGNKGRPFIRSYSTEKAIELFRNIIEKHHRRMFHIVDDNFLFFKSRCIEICKFLEKYKINFNLSGRVDNVDDEILIALKKAGCNYIAFGIESGSQRMLDFLRKGVSMKQNIRAVKLCKKHGMTCDANLIIGLPEENPEDLRKTVNFVKSYQPEVVNVHRYTPIPSNLFNYCISKKLLQKPNTLEEWSKCGDINNNQTKKNFSNIREEELKKAAREMEKFHFYRRRFKRFLFWIKKGELKHLVTTLIRKAKKFNVLF